METLIGQGTAPTQLTVFYDERCALCRRARDWLLTQPCLIEVTLLPAGSHEARALSGDYETVGKELVAMDEHGNMWVGPSAYIACMWATARYRSWAYRLTKPALAPHAERVFRWIARRRSYLGAFIGSGKDECSWCEEQAAAAS